MKSHSKKMKWTEKEDTLLMEAVYKLGTKSWKAIAECVPERTGKQCRERWLGQLNPIMSKEKWSAEEDLKLINAQKMNGNRWSIIASYIPGRSAISIKNRWSWLLRHGLTTPGFDGIFPSSPENQEVQEPVVHVEHVLTSKIYLNPINVSNFELFGEDFLKFQNSLNMLCSL